MKAPPHGPGRQALPARNLRGGEAIVVVFDQRRTKGFRKPQHFGRQHALGFDALNEFGGLGIRSCRLLLLPSFSTAACADLLMECVPERPSEPALEIPVICRWLAQGSNPGL